MYKGSQEASIQEEHRDKSVQHEVYAYSSDQSGIDTIHVAQIPDDDQRDMNWVNYFIFNRYLDVQVAYLF